MDDLLTNWPLVAVPTIVYCVVMVIGSRKLDATYQSLNGRISSRDDLMIMKKTINRDMTLAFILIIFVLVYISGMFYLAFAGKFTLLTTAIYVPVLTTTAFICSLFYTRKVEKRAKNMSVTAEDPSVLETYRLWIKQWSEPRFRLPE